MNLFRRFLSLGVIIGPLPNNIVNGTVEDASQVQGNFNWIVSQVNANATAGAGTVARNIVINGDMSISQRYITTQKIIAGGNKAYILDRWQGSAGAGSSLEIEQLTSTGLGQFQYAQRVQRQSANAATTLLQIAQSLETSDSIQMAGQTVTLSFWARAGANYSAASGALVATVYSGTGTDENVLTGYTGSAASVTQTFNTVNSWARYSVTGVMPTTTNEAGIVFAFTPTGTAGTADYIDITGVQLELSPSASNFDFEVYASRIDRCSRYYTKAAPHQVIPAQAGGTTGAAEYAVLLAGAKQIAVQCSFPARMRIAPTITTYNPAAANALWRNTTQNTDSGAATAAVGETGMSLHNAQVAGDAVGDIMYLQWSADSEL